MRFWYCIDDIGKNDSGNQLSKNAQYTGTFMNKEDISIYRLLNQWIDETAPTLYPGYPFTRWTDGGENLPAVFRDSVQIKSRFLISLKKRLFI